MASSEDNSMDEDKEEEESDDDLEQKRVIAILQPQNRSDNTRDSQGRLRLKVGSPTRGDALRAAAPCFTRGQPHSMSCCTQLHRLVHVHTGLSTGDARCMMLEA